MENSNNKNYKKDKNIKEDIFIYFCAVSIVVTTIFILSTFFYIFKVFEYSTKFFPHTYINGIDVSKKTSKEVSYLINKKLDDYTLDILAKGVEEEKISANEIYMVYSAYDDVERLIKEQDNLNWYSYLKNYKYYELDKLVTFEKDKVSNIVRNFDYIQKIKEHDLPYLKENIKENQYLDYIFDEGVLDAENEISSQLNKLKKECSLEKSYLLMELRLLGSKVEIEKNPNSDDKNKKKVDEINVQIDNSQNISSNNNNQASSTTTTIKKNNNQVNNTITKKNTQKSTNISNNKKSNTVSVTTTQNTNKVVNQEIIVSNIISQKPEEDTVINKKNKKAVGPGVSLKLEESGPSSSIISEKGPASNIANISGAIQINSSPNSKGPGINVN